MHLSRKCPFSNKTNLHLELPGLAESTQGGLPLKKDSERGKSIRIDYNISPGDFAWKVVQKAPEPPNGVLFSVVLGPLDLSSRTVQITESVTSNRSDSAIQIAPPLHYALVVFLPPFEKPSFKLSGIVSCD